MARTRRRREIDASSEQLWEVVADPHHLPRWWPGVERVEDASAQQWTEVFRSRRGRTVRADFTVLESRRPECLTWQQEVEATPFERFIAESVTEVRLEPGRRGSGTRIELTLNQRLRGWARLGAFLFRGASVRRLDEALANLDAIVAGPAA
jgi:uncharacterized protein YndB with AHSA1/START domain